MSNMKHVKKARAYKDAVFVDLFSEDITAKQNFLSLYNALYDTNLSDETVLQKCRLEQVIYTGLRNDVSFLVDNKLLVLTEHQSTINENMPLRCLEYVARLYERMQCPKSRYSRKLIKIPEPDFFVLYNGEENYPVRKELKLSDAFFLSQKDNLALELKVTLININKSKRSEVLQKCKILNDYSAFVEAVRKHSLKDAEEGFENAITECINRGILKDYLERKSREVRNMLIGEYDYEMDMQVRYEEALEDAMEKLQSQFQEQIQKQVKEQVQKQVKEEREQMFKKTLEMAKTLKDIGLTVDKIVMATKLPQEEVEAL